MATTHHEHLCTVTIVTMSTSADIPTLAFPNGARRNLSTNTVPQWNKMYMLVHRIAPQDCVKYPPGGCS